MRGVYLARIFGYCLEAGRFSEGEMGEGGKIEEIWTQKTVRVEDDKTMQDWR